MKFLKRILLLGLAALLLLAAGIFIYWSTGSTRIESWIGAQLLSLCGDFINPELHFEKITYIRPRTVVLDKLSLTTPDPEHPGSTLVILAVKQARIELTEIPQRGQPIRFSQIMLDSPEFRAIAIKSPGEGAGDGGGGGGFAGYSHFIKSSPTAAPPAAAPPTAAPATHRAASAAAPMKLSDVLLIRQIQIKNGLVRYDPRIANAQPMQLDGINTTLDFAPISGTGAATTGPAGERPGAGAGGGDGGSGGAALYALQTTVIRDPVFKLDLAGAMDIDTITFNFSRLALNLDLRPENAHFLPPEVQQILNDFQIAGQLQLTAAGSIPMADFTQTRLQADLSLVKAQTALGKYRLAIDSLSSDVDQSNGKIALKNLDASLLGGTLHAGAEIPFDSGLPAQFSLQADGLRIEQTLRTVDPAKPPLYSGMLSADVTYSAPLGQWKTRSGGSGTASLRNGRMINMPVLGPILAAIDNVVAATFRRSTQGPTDSADARFAFSGDHVDLESYTAQLGILALRASGTIGFDQRLDLKLNAGPLEQIQNSMGPIGKLLGQATDAMLSYRVSGTISSPRVSVEVGGR